ncbi:hypothetical protein PMAYCL1PPCAC_12099, partial [Pristionchus mayeri]
RWKTISPMKIGRFDGAAASLNGFIYVVGGVYDFLNRKPDPILSDLERYCPKTDSWTTLKGMKTARRSSFLFAHSGKLLVFGGRGGRHFVHS